MFLGRSRAVLAKMLDDIRKIAFTVNIVVQIVFLAFYGYSIYNSINKWVFFAIYTCLLILSVIAFINTLATHNSKKKKTGFERFLRVSKYFINGALLVVNAYQTLAFSGDSLSIILLIVSAISLVVQVIVEFVRIFIERYVALFAYSIDKDVGWLGDFIEDPKGTLWTLVDQPFESLSDKIENKQRDVSPEEEKVETLYAEFAPKEKEREKDRNRQKKERSDRIAKEQKSELVSHIKTVFGSIFKKKDKDNQD